MASISIDIQLDEIFYELDDKHLLAEVKRRKLKLPSETRDAVSTAIAQIRRGDSADAITTLEREFWPKWASVEDSESALRMATLFAPANDNTSKEAALGAVATGGVA